MKILINAEQRFDKDIDVFSVGFDPVQIGKQSFVACINIEHGKHIEFVTMLPYKFVLV